MMRRSAPEVQQSYSVTGEVDFIFVITARDMSECEGLASWRRHCQVDDGAPDDLQR
jgi:DNA-binding Lrp family transcriptional regulator